MNQAAIFIRLCVKKKIMCKRPGTKKRVIAVTQDFGKILSGVWELDGKWQTYFDLAHFVLTEAVSSN